MVGSGLDVRVLSDFSTMGRDAYSASPATEEVDLLDQFSSRDTGGCSRIWAARSTSGARVACSTTWW